MPATKKDTTRNLEELNQELEKLRARNKELEASEKVLEYVEGALQETEKRYRSLFDNMQSGFAIHKIVLDENNKPKDYIFIDVNSEFEVHTGLKKEEVIGKRVTEVLPGIEDDPARWIEVYGEVALSGKGVSFENYLETLQRWYSVIAYSPKAGQFATVFTDITEYKKAEAERKKWEEQQRQTQKMEALRTLAGGIAHEFNNVLGTIVGFAELTMDLLPEEGRGRYNLKKVLSASDRAAEMVDQILSFSSREEKEYKPVYINNVLREALFLLRSSLPPTIEIRTNLKERQTRILADLLQVHHVIMNICNNAAHAMKEKGGILGISLDEVNIDPDANGQVDLNKGRYQKISISDTGHGMDEETKRRIFEPYFTTKRVGEGSGMGLSVAHGIVKSHGGTITVDSEPGQGTTVHVFFPVIKSERFLGADSKAPVKGGNEWLLMADDESDLLESGRKMLESLGYTVVMKKSSLEALEAFSKKPDAFNLVITDQTMPGMTGVQLTKELKRIKPDIPVILCTGFSEIVNEENYKAQGIDAFVMKPFDKKKIAHIIRQVLDKK